MDEKKFCTACGRYLEPDMQFCPQCGKVVYGSDAEAQFKAAESNVESTVKDIRRTWLMFFLLIYAVPVILAGIYALVDSSALANSVWESNSFQSWIDDHNLNYSHSDVEMYILVIGALVLVSGICALGSSILVYKKQKWLYAVILCLVASLLCFWSIFGMIMGFLVTWLIVDSKDLFEN